MPPFAGGYDDFDIVIFPAGEALSAELVAKRMAALEPDIVEIAEGCVNKALDEESVDFMAAIPNVVPITMISRLIGIHDSPLDELSNAAFDSTAMLGSTLSYDELVSPIARSGEFQEWVSRHP